METEMKSETNVSAASVIRRAAHSVNSVLSGEFSNSAASEFSIYLSCELFSNGFDLNSSSFGRSRESSARFKEYICGMESLDITDELNKPDWESNQSYLSLDFPSSRGWSPETGDFSNKNNSEDDGQQFNGDVSRVPVFGFPDTASEDEDGFPVGFSQKKSKAMQRGKKDPETRRKRGNKGSCYRCLKGNRFTEKEVCIVCDAKYCSNCVLRAMGSMFEGRKCVSCVGYPIDEAKRGSLGTCSRMLKRMLDPSKVKQIMNAEKLCMVNQLPAEYVCVNGKPLCRRELFILQTCPNPPKKLMRGNYWYDKASGFWGKKGQKPSEIISPDLNIGGPIKPNASKGNTKLFINGPAITNAELYMLQSAGVQCSGNERFWVNADGSYVEEGQKFTKEYIWGKGGMKLVRALLSLPVPPKSSNTSTEVVSSQIGRSVADNIDARRTLQKLLLIGRSGSGTSTIFKQAKILYKDLPFSKDERENIKWKVQSNVYRYLGILLQGRERFEEESLGESGKKLGPINGADGKTIYTINPRLKAFSDWLLKIMVSGKLEDYFPAAAREYAHFVKELWEDAAMQATYSRRGELEMLPSVASYFLERVVDITRTEYEPSHLDILYAEGIASSNGLASVNFLFPHSASDDDDVEIGDQQEPLLEYQLIRAPARGLGETCKWMEMFEDVGMVIFCVALSDYDQFDLDGNGSLTNKIILSSKLIESIVTHPTFAEMEFLLILNKFDLFEEKIGRVPLNQCDWFDDFNPEIGRLFTGSKNRNILSFGQLAFHYVAVKFKRLYSSLTGRKLYVSLVTGMEPNSVDAALRYAREILKWDEEKTDFSLSDCSFYSSEGSSFSD